VEGEGLELDGQHRRIGIGDGIGQPETVALDLDFGDAERRVLERAHHDPGRIGLAVRLGNVAGRVHVGALRHWTHLVSATLRHRQPPA